VWIDSHCHVTADRYDEDRAAVLERAADARVTALVAIGAGYGIDGNAEAVALAESDPRVFATVGVHPHDASQFAPDVLVRLRGWLASPRVVAVGECGLDYHYMNSPRDAQREALAAQLRLARELGMPVSIHVRDDGEAAYDELLELWCSEGAGELEGVLHCYTGSLDFARRAVAERFFVSFSGIVTFKKSQALREVAAGLPLDRLMVETDAPFLAPEGHRGRRNEPAWVGIVGQTLARIHGVAPDEVARITSENARRFYRLPDGAGRPEEIPDE